MNEKDIYKNRNLGMTYEEAKELVRKSPLLYFSMPPCFQTEELRDIASETTVCKAYDIYEYYKNNPDEFKTAQEDIKKQKLEKFGMISESDSINKSIQKNNISDNDTDEDQDVVDFLKYLKKENKLDKLKKIIEKTELDD